MNVYAVAEGDRAGKTATALNLAVALREAGAEAMGVVPEDARTQALEPGFFAVTESPVANAYGRLADSTLEWDGTSAVLGATGDGGGREEAAESEPTTDDSDDDDDSGGFLSGLLGR
jgi:hypothetical protein